MVLTLVVSMVAKLAMQLELVFQSISLFGLLRPHAQDNYCLVVLLMKSTTE